MMDKFLLVANWKANTPNISNFEFRLPAGEAGISDLIEIAIAPQFPDLDKIFKPFERCAQDVSQFPDGSHTGEVTAKELKSLEVEYVLIGHSERRTQFGQTNDDIAEKILRAQEQGIKVILCANNESEIIGHPEFIMYEPKTAISQPGNFHPENLENVAKTIAGWQQKYSAKFLYGGSINPENCKEYCQIQGISGFVVGQASLTASTFEKIYENILSTLP